MVTQKKSSWSLWHKHPAGLRLQHISHVHCSVEVCLCINVFWPLMSPVPSALRWWHQPMLSSILLLCCPTVLLEAPIHTGCQWKPHPSQTRLSWRRYSTVLKHQARLTRFQIKILKWAYRKTLTLTNHHIVLTVLKPEVTVKSQQVLRSFMCLRRCSAEMMPIYW